MLPTRQLIFRLLPYLALLLVVPGSFRRGPKTSLRCIEHWH